MLFPRAIRSVGAVRHSITLELRHSCTYKNLFSPHPPTLARGFSAKTFPSSFPPIARRHCSHMCPSAADHQREVLPTNVKPLRYDLTLEPLFDSFTFNGDLTIDLQVNEDTSFISLNSLEIEVASAEVNGKPVSKTSYDEEQQTVTFDLAEELKKGSKAALKLSFKGILNDKMAGFYRSSYQDKDGKTRYLATTQMEPTDCRRAFPSFDEPALKAIFEISLISDKSLVHLSNMDVKETKDLGDSKKKTIFNPTPLMSTYLVAFIVGDLKYVENTSYNVPIKVWATPGLEHLGQYSADIAAQTLAFFDKKFDIPYPLPKLDMVAIHDFSAGAMENYGLITYRNVDLLLDPENTNINTKQRVTETVMHELAHQWFGNLVTMDFWDGLWLNEGFATWMSWYACDALYPDWKVWESYVSDSLQQALTLDALRSSHPIEVPVRRADEINQIFDAISYSKGASLLKMISRWLGEGVFIKGVSNYLKKHKWGNTKTSDLWHSLSEVSGKNVVEVMDIWTKNTGFPIVKVDEAADGTLTFTQHRFLATADVKPEEDKVLYPVFLGLKTSGGIDETLTLTDRSKQVKVDLKDDFYKVNGDQSGIYRTAYTPERWTKLGEAGVTGKLSVEDRIGLVADASSLASSGFVATTGLLDLVKAWSGESNYSVWDQILTSIAQIKAAMIFEDEEVTKAINVFVVDLISSKLNEVGYEFKPSDSFADQQLKSSLFSAAAAAGHQKSVDYALEAFQKFVKGDKKAFHPNLRASIFFTNAKHGNEETFNQLLHIYKNPQSVEEKNTALRALGRFTDESLLTKVTDLLLQTDVVKPQDIYIPMQGLRAHRKGIEHLWGWVTKKWDDVYKLLPPGLSMLSAVVTLSTSGFTTLKQKEEVEKFFAEKNTKGYDQGLAQALDVVSAKSKWASRDLEVIKSWLRKNEYSSKL